jgi:hypothetical protein
MRFMNSMGSNMMPSTKGAKVVPFTLVAMSLPGNFRLVYRVESGGAPSAGGSNSRRIVLSRVFGRIS